MSFFSFAPSDGYISKSFEGLKHRKPPPTLLRLLQSGSVANPHWIAVGPIEESWFISYVDSDGFDQIVYGDATPSSLKRYLYDAKRRRFLRDEHVRVVFGPENGFFAWDRSSLRWSNLPTSLEETIQGWLTPAGWKVGPPRMIAIGADNAWFALSEYGEVEYRLPKSWPTLADTMDEWEDEGFDWTELAFISFDASKIDQFVAIRTDGTWAGSCDETNANALESFTAAFFSIPSSKPRPNSSHSKSKPPPKSSTPPRYTNGTTSSAPQPGPEASPNANDQALYETWSTSVGSQFAAALAARGGGPPKKLQIRNQRSNSTTKPIPSPSPSSPPLLLSSFPHIPPQLATCTQLHCVPAKSQPNGLKACKHDVEKLFRGSGMYSYEFLRQERLRWHPDRFGRLCEEGFREEGRKIAEEMWKIIDGLMAEEEKSRRK